MLKVLEIAKFSVSPLGMDCSLKRSGELLESHANAIIRVQCRAARKHKILTNPPCFLFLNTPD